MRETIIRWLYLGGKVAVGLGLFILLGSWIFSGPPSEETKLDQEKRVYEVQRKLTTADLPCVRPMISVTFDSRPTGAMRVNPNGECAVDAFWPDDVKACVLAKSADSDTIQGPYGNCDGAKPGRPVDVEYVWSAGASFKGRIKLSPRRVTQVFR